MRSLLTVLASAVALAAAEVVEISNTECRTDVDGNLMDTHDGNIMQWEENGLYWYYSMGYKDCEIEHGTIPP